MGARHLPHRLALYVDFDNVFSALCAQAPEAAEAFVLEPARWLEWIGGRPSEGTDGTCSSGRILIRRCYLNPNGSLLLQNGERVFFGSFRANLVRAGFQVTDCPPLTRGGKTSADIVMVMDMLDAIHHSTHFNTFVIVSSDADFTPVLQRLRAHDRRTVVVSIGSAADAYRAAADEVIGPEVFIRDGLGFIQEQPVPEALPPRSADAGESGMTAPALPEEGTLEASMDPAATREAILSHIAAELARSSRPLHLPTLGGRLHRQLGPQVRATAFGGAGTLRRLLATAGDPHMELVSGSGGGWVRDPARHRVAPLDDKAEA